MPRERKENMDKLLMKTQAVSQPGRISLLCGISDFILQRSKYFRQNQQTELYSL
jgi:hypothetical protein